MTFAITQARPAAKLGPSRPSAKPVGFGTLLSILGVVFINFWFIVCRYVMKRENGDIPKIDDAHSTMLF